MIVDEMDIYDSRYGIFQPIYDHHAYHRLAISRTEVPGGQPLLLIGRKPEGLEFPDEGQKTRVFAGSRDGRSPDPKATAAKRFAAEAYIPGNQAAAKDSGSGKTPAGAVISIADVKRKFAENAGDPLVELPSGPPAATLSSTAFPKPLDPVDDLPPATVITFVGKAAEGKRVVRGTTSDNGTVKRVLVNGQEARAAAPNFAEWAITLAGVPSGEWRVTASAEDAAGNVEKTPHVVTVAAPH
jgi:hypothetical protein